MVSSSSPRDNWEKLVAAVVKKDQIWQLCHQDSITTVSSNSQTPSNSDGEILSISSSRSRRISESSPRQTLLTSASGFGARKNASGTITQKLFSALPRRRKPKDHDLGQGLVGIPEDHFGLQSFSLLELLIATENFSKNNVLGHGRHSTMYKGQLTDGSLVAVRRLTADLKVMGNELEITSTTAHRNVLRARGFCITEKERLLVYPYMVNGNVASWLRGRHEAIPPLEWQVRKQIALGAAKGLAYLHYECPRKIIHLDLKAANILLADDFEAVISDFNLAEFIDCYDNDVITAIKGTIGHIAPEYLATSKCSVKNDVFSYGIFLLELITGQRAFDLARLANDDDAMLLNWVKGNYKDSKWDAMVDANLQLDFVVDEVEELLQIGLTCTQTDPEERPTILEVLRMLEDSFYLDKRWEELCMKDFRGEILEQRHIESFTLDELEAATENFSHKIISDDGFNIVYEGRLADGSAVAVKRYTSSSLEYYFEKELDIGRMCLHPNLVHVIGFCQTPEDRLLVFHMMVNGSVESWLRGSHSLTWRKRKGIALGVARGLAYLHDNGDKKVIHRDVKASNILLDDNLEAVVADFKLALPLNCNETHVTTIVAGTIGHIAPEYLASGTCSDKTDVFGYGAFLLELLTGQRIVDFLEVADDEDMFCADWVKRNYEDRRWEFMVDKGSRCNMIKAVVKQLVKIAVLCTQYDPDKRPKMLEVVRMIEIGFDSTERSEAQFENEVGEDGEDGLASDELFEPR